MSGTAAVKQLNNVFPEATEYTLCPLYFLGKKRKGDYSPFAKVDGKPLARGKTKILSYIWTAQKNFGKDVEISKTRFAKKCGMSKYAVNHDLNQLIFEDKVIKPTGKNKYEINLHVNESPYIVFDNCLHTQKFDIDGKIKKLSATAVIVLEYIKAFYLRTDKNGEYVNYDFKNRKPKHYFMSSNQGLATQLNLPTSTVSYALPQLLKAGLMYRNKRLRYKDDNDNAYYKIVQEKGVTGNTLGLFVVPYEVLVIEQRSTYTPQEVKFIQDLDEIEVSETEIQEVYRELRENAETAAATARETAFNDEEYIEAEAELEAAQTAAFAALENGEDTAAAKARWDDAQDKYYKRLDELGLSETDFYPQYLCRRCKDTGTVPDTGQRCRCRTRIKELIISRIFKA